MVSLTKNTFYVTLNAQPTWILSTMNHYLAYLSKVQLCSMPVHTYWFPPTCTILLCPPLIHSDLEVGWMIISFRVLACVRILLMIHYTSFCHTKHENFAEMHVNFSNSFFPSSQIQNSNFLRGRIWDAQLGSVGYLSGALWEQYWKRQGQCKPGVYHKPPQMVRAKARPHLGSPSK